MKIVVATGELLEAWRTIHNQIIPDDPLSAKEVADRSSRHRLTVAYANDLLIGNATVRPPSGPDHASTVIVRILAEHRNQGLGSAYFEAELDEAFRMGARRVETVVLASNVDGLAFAQARGFVEHDRYVLDGDTTAFVDLHLGMGSEPDAHRTREQREPATTPTAGATEQVDRRARG